MKIVELRSGREDGYFFADASNVELEDRDFFSNVTRCNKKKVYGAAADIQLPMGCRPVAFQKESCEQGAFATAIRITQVRAISTSDSCV